LATRWTLSARQLFSPNNARAGFWQVPVDPKNRSKTAFATHRGLYDFLRMPFGLTNASSTFQRNIDLILSRVKLKTALVYLDDIIIFSASFEHHLQDVEDVLALCGLAMSNSALTRVSGSSRKSIFSDTT
jgi:hypothetical protein